MDARLETHRTVAEAKDNLIAAVSHELRTPLTSISGFADILKDDQTMSPAQHDMVEVIDAEAKELARMVEDFLVAARFDHDIVELDTGDIEVMATIRPMVEAAEASAVKSRSIPGNSGSRETPTVSCTSPGTCSRTPSPRWPQHSSGGSQRRGPGTLVIADDGPGIPSDASTACLNRSSTKAAEPWSPAALAWACGRP